MTVLLVLFTLILFLVFDHVVQRYRAHPILSVRENRVRSGAAMQLPIDVPRDVSLATNHTWIRRNPDGTITVGFDEFLSRLMGLAERVSLPQPGELVQPNVADVSVMAHSKTLRLAPPVVGDVVDANLDVIKNPSLILNDPYGKGWLMRVKPRADNDEQSRPFVVVQPLQWLRDQAALVRDFIVMNTQQGELVTLQEGGLPMEGALQRLDEGAWSDFTRSFASLHRGTETESKEIRS